MTEALHLIDVFIGEIDAAGEGDPAVDHADLAVIAIVQAGVHTGAQEIEGNCLDVVGGKLPRIGSGKTADTAEVIVDETDLDAGGSTFLEELQNGIPHETFFDDEIFEEDEFLCTGQLLAQHSEKILAQRGIFHLRAGICGIAGNPADIIGLDAEFGVGFHKCRGIACLLGIEGSVRPAVCLCLFAVAAGDRLIAEFKVEKAA